MRRQKSGPTAVAFHGNPGAWSEAAALALYGEETETLPCRSPAEAFQAVEKGKAAHVIVPVEHSLTGSDHRSYDLFLRHHLSIVAETYFPIVHCLVAHPGVKLMALRRVYSHPHALEQCRSFLNRLGGAQFHPEGDTAGAVARIKRRGLMDAAAVASERAAEIYGMKVLARAIEDPPANITRFLLLAEEPIEPKRRAKSSIVFAVKDLTRQFFSCISLFALRELPLSKIESRPVKGRNSHFLFYLDVTRSLSDPDLEQALAQLHEIAPWVRVLGCYPQGRQG